jgi:hypothetical protein
MQIKIKTNKLPKKVLVIVHFNYFWNVRVFLARQAQDVLLDRFPPFKPCANGFFSLLFLGRVKVAPMS